MSTTVSYKGNTIATLNNETKTLTTAGTWVEGNIEIVDTKDNPTLQAKTNITPTESSQTITADSGYDGLSSVQINAVSSTYVGSGINRRDETDLTASGATVTVPAGFYAEQETKSVASGTAGTPTATKGSVSNHSISVTPSVTNTTGYITGGTKTGTAVTVSASELVSGTLSITSSGTKDVTNYASASVASGTEGTPTATKGTVSNHQVTVTPSVTNSAGYITGSTKTGTAVTVTASELASGNKEITQNGTNIDVVGYSTVSVAVPSSSTALITDTTDAAGGTIRTITTTDEVYLQTKTITPTSTQQTVLPDTGYDGFSSVIVGASSGGSSAISLIDTITISANTRGISIDLSTYLSNYDILIIAQDVTLSESDWLYYSPNASSPTGGSYNDGSKISHTGVCFWYLPLGGSSRYCYGYIANANFSQSNTTSTPISNLYIYTYVSTKMITAGSTFKVYGGNYADL